MVDQAGPRLDVVRAEGPPPVCRGRACGGGAGPDVGVLGVVHGDQCAPPVRTPATRLSVAPALRPRCGSPRCHHGLP
ncbi:hypothetical protein [Ornithinimicrobium kibberense]|uniref:hypothetical protein n=1 Tax=Ornithinimicrobium kibberense TaxID=282060 RepID=UPI00361C4ED4